LCVLRLTLVSILVLLALLLWPAAATATPLWRPVFIEPVFVPPSGDLSVTLSVRSERSDERNGVSGFLSLAVPLDRFAAPKRLVSNADDAARQAETEPAETERSSPPKSVPEAPRAPALPAALFARLARDTLGAAFRAHAVSVRRAELDGLSTRARASAALPELRLRVLRSNDQSMRLAPTLEDPEHYSLDGGDNLVLEGSATWRLNRLVFADEEIAVKRLELEQERNTEKLTARVLERLFAWHRAWTGLGGAEPEARAPLELELVQAEVELDVLTGGWFADQARRFRDPGYKPDVSRSSSRSPSSSTRTLPTPSQ
jgi:hypothetical protein